MASLLENALSRSKESSIDDELIPENISLDLIDPDPEQDSKYDKERLSESSIESFARSLKRTKLEKPISVYKIEETGRYVIIGGERRYRAFKYNGETSIPAFVKYVIKNGVKLDPEADFKIHIGQASENSGGVKLNPLAESYSMQKTRDKASKAGVKITQQDIADIHNCKLSHVKKVSPLIKYNERVQALIQTNKLLDLKVIVQVQKLSKEDPAVFEEVAEKIELMPEDGVMSREALANLINEARTVGDANSGGSEQSSSEETSENTSSAPSSESKPKDLLKFKKDLLNLVAKYEVNEQGFNIDKPEEHNVFDTAMSIIAHIEKIENEGEK